MIGLVRRALLPAARRDLLRVALLAAAALPFLSGWEQSLDAPFHLEMGRRILEGDFPRANFVALVDPERPWQDDDALFQVLFAISHGFGEGVGLGGAAGVVLLRILLVGGTLALALSIRPGWLRLTAPIAAIFLFGLDERIAARPEWLSAFLLMLTLRLLLPRPQGASPADGRAGWLLPPITALWANGHGYFILGQALVVLWAISPRGPRREPEAAGDERGEGEALFGSLFRPGSRARRFLLAFLCVLAAAATPYGGETLLYPVRILRDVFLGDAGIRLSVEEFARFPWSESGVPLPGLLAIAAAGAIALSAAFSLDRSRVFGLAAALGLFACALVARRNLALFLLAAIPILADALDPVRPARLVAALRSLRESRRLSHLAEAVLAAAALAAWAGAGLSNAIPIATGGTRGIRDADGREGLAPADAGLYWRMKHLHGPLLNNFNAGAWIVGAFRGEEKVFIDGRPEAYGEEFFRFYRDVAAGRVPLRLLEQRYGIRAIFLTLPYADSLVLLERAAQDPSWEPAFLDPRAAILLRSATPANEAALADRRIGTDPAAGGDPRLVRAHGRALLALGKGLSARGPGASALARECVARARAALESAARRDSGARLDAALAALAAGDADAARGFAEPFQARSPAGVSILARIDGSSGRPRDALARLEQGVRRFPRAIGLRLQLAQALAEAGRLREAALSCREARARGADDPLAFEIEAEALRAEGPESHPAAREALARGLERFPWALGLRRLDALWRAESRDPAALAAAREIAADYPGEPEAWLALGEAAFLLRSYPDAQAAFSRILDISPRGPLARTARARLSALEALHRAGPGR